MPPEDSPSSESRGHRKGLGPVGAYVLEHLALQPTHRVLEVGCMDGALAWEIARRTAYVTGVDPSVEFVAAAEDRRIQSGADNLSFGEMSADHLPFDDATFDIIVSHGTLHRLENPLVIVREMERVLRPVGKLYLADTIGADDPALREVQEKVELVRFGPPINLFSLQELRAAAAIDPLLAAREFAFTEEVDIADWMPPNRVDPATREKVSHILVAIAKKKAREFKVHVAGRRVTFARRWVLIVAEKAGPS